MVALSVVASRRAESYDTIRLLDPIKLDGAQKPVAVAASSRRFYVADEKKNQILIYEASGGFVKAVGGSGKDALAGPRGVAVGSEEKVFVADTGNSRIRVFDGDGNAIGSFGEKGSRPGLLRGPEAVAVGQDGRVYVADTGNNRVQVFTEQGILLFSIGSSGKLPGQFSSPTKLAVDASDNLYVLVSGNDRLQTFDEDRFGHDGGGGGAIARDVAGFRGNFADHAGAHVFIDVFQVDFLGHGDAVLGDGRRAKALLQDHVATLGAERHFDGTGQLGNAAPHGIASFLIKGNHFRHGVVLSFALGSCRAFGFLYWE